MTAAQHAMAEGDYRARGPAARSTRATPSPTNAAVLRLMTLAFWQAGDLPAAGRAVRDWARVERDRPTPHRFAARIYEDMGAIDLAAEAAERAARRAPDDADAWERVGRLRLRLMDRDGARSTRWSARAASGPSVDGLLDLALAYHLAGDLGGEVTRVRAGDAASTPESAEAAWSRYAHALARTDGVSDGDRRLRARARARRRDAEVAELLERLRDALPRVLPAA